MSELTHVEQIRRDMPATGAHVYLNAGTFGPLPIYVMQAMQERLQFEMQEGRLGPKSFEGMSSISAEARSSVARLLHADVEEIALTDNTGEGLNIIINGCAWHEGDEVITTNHEHISALAPLYQNRDRYGITIRFADLGPQANRSAVEAVREQVTERTRLIVLSHVTWTTGARLDVQGVGQLGRELNIPVLVDGAQSAGAIPLDMQALGVPFYAIPMQKWLCGPDGTGALYVNREALCHAVPTYVGYWSVKHEEGIEWELADFAQRFEVGGRQTAALAGQCAVLHWLENTVGYDWLFARIASLHRYAYDTLMHVPGLTMLTPEAGASGLIAFTMHEQDDAEIVTTLREKHNIYVRNIPSTHAIRVSTGFYNTEQEIDQLVAALSSL